MSIVLVLASCILHGFLKKFWLHPRRTTRKKANPVVFWNSLGIAIFQPNASVVNFHFTYLVPSLLYSSVQFPLFYQIYSQYLVQNSLSFLVHLIQPSSIYMHIQYDMFLCNSPYMYIYLSIYTHIYIIKHECVSNYQYMLVYLFIFYPGCLTPEPVL